MKIKNILLLVLALAMVFALCACGGTAANSGDSETTTESTAESTADNKNEQDPDDGKVTYTVTVVDEGGNPVAGAFVQLCLEACVPGATDAQGKAVFNLEEADYKVSFVSMPTGYTCDETEFHFAEGSYELTITLKAVA